MLYYKFYKLICWLGLFCILITAGNNTFANNDEVVAKPKVLFLNSYHKGYYWSDEITRGIEETLNSSIIDLHIEYLDTKRQFDDDFQKILTTMLKLKHSKFNYDLIVTSDNNAFNYLKKYRSEIANNTPVVFCGVNYVQQSDVEGYDNFVGVNEYSNIIGNIQLIKDLHPLTRKVIIITDNTTTGKKVQGEVLRIKNDGSVKNISIELWYDFTAEELCDTIHTIKGNTVFLYTFYIRDKENVFYEYDVSSEMITRSSKVPVYGTFDFNFGHGIVGGILTSGYEQGKKAGELALRVLNGETFEGNQISEALTTKLLFDYEMVNKYKVDLSRLNMPYEIVNQPTSFFYRHKVLIRNLIILFAFLLLIILVLMYGYVKTLKLKRQLSVSKTQLSSLVTNMPGAVYRCVADQKWKMIYLSPQIKNICGFDAVEFEMDHDYRLASIIFPNDYELVKNKINEAIKQKIPWEINYRIMHKDGTIRWVSEFGRGIENHEGKIDLLDGLIIDITKRKVAEEAQQRTERKFEKVFNNSPVGVMYYNKDGVIVECNELFAEILGASKDELIGFELFKGVKDEDLKDAIENSLSIGSGQYSDYYTSIISGKCVPVKAVFKGILDDIGIFSNGIGIIEDITEQVKAEKEILDTNERLKTTNGKLLATTDELSKTNKNLLEALEEAKKSKALEKANEELRENERVLRKAHDEIKKKQDELEHLNLELKLSHDEMQQLNEELISANDQLHAQTEELEATIQKLKETQLQLIQSEKMASVGVLTAGVAHEINNPLNYIQGGKTAIELFVEDNVNEYSEGLKVYLEMIQDGIEKAVKIVRSLNHFNRRSEEFSQECDVYAILDNCLVMLGNQLKYKVKVIKKYTSEPFLLIGNEGRLHQLFLNILQNSTQAIVEKGEIIIKSQIKDNMLLISINDDGYGISEKNLARITDPFFTTKPPGEGTGLGLSIAYNIVKEHNGDLRFDSIEGDGTTVTVSLPLTESK